MIPIKTVIHKIFRHNADPVVHSNSSRWLRKATSAVSPRRRRSQKSGSLRPIRPAAPRIPSMQYDDFATPFDTFFTPALTASQSDDTRSPSTPGTPWTPWSGTRSISISSAKIRKHIFRRPDSTSDSEVYLSPISLWEVDDVVYDPSDEDWIRDEHPDQIDTNSLLWRKVVQDLLRTSDPVPTPK
ncbi:hypothetical protein QCA50_006069 [Cerrena zonata]|uniref:Uncharacterized protein n=1 Tax=Cerrena zonata TaxID=2478898 RepID=A0AAW0GC74_9APHY